MIPNFRISKYFSFNEMVNTSDAELHQHNAEQGVPKIFELVEFCQTILDEAREAMGSALFVASGFRCPELNTKLAGSPASKHLYGHAADLYQPGWGWNEAQQAAKTFYDHFKAKGIKADVVASKRGPAAVWVHVEYDEAGPRLFTEIDRVLAQVE